MLAHSTLFGQQIEGKVVDASNQNPIPFARIYFVDFERGVAADSLGYWSYKNVPQNQPTIHAIISAPGYKTTHIDIQTQFDGFQILSLTALHHQLDEVVISNGGYLHRESITNIESHQLSELNKIPSSTLGESLSKIPGVYQTGIGKGVSKPVIRGLSGSSVVTYINSLRIENQQWGADHGLPLTTLGIGQVEVIKGPASLLFGADAMGGVVYFVDEPYAENNSYSGFIQSRFEHNTLGTINSGGFRYSKNHFRFNVYGGYDNFADYTAPGLGQVKNSRFNQSAAKLSMGYHKRNWLINFRYNFYHGYLGLPGHTHDSVPDLSSFYSEDQIRRNTIPAQINTNHFFSLEHKIFFKKQEIQTTIGHTRSGLKEHEEKVTIPDIILDLNNTLINTKWKYKPNNNWNYTLGFQGMYQINRNDPAAIEILIPNSETTDAGIYGLIRYMKNKWRVLLGGRADTRIFNTAELNDNNQFSGYNFSAGFARIGGKSTTRFNISSGFRAPTATELLADGVHHGSFRYEKGNVNLNPEQAIQFDFSQAFHGDDFEVIVNPFYNRIANYIYLSPTNETEGSYPVFNWTQANFAQLYGLDFGIHYHPHRAHWLHIQSSVSTVFAEDANRQPLPRIPQSRIQNRFIINIQKGKKFELKDLTIDYTYQFLQDRIISEETIAPAFHLIDAGLNMSYTGKQTLLFSLGVRNILNTRYIDHLSGLKYLHIPNPGINAYFSVQYQFNHKVK
jgi:iron complex outermembrane receptor protein